jgi:hypothetical protein
MGELHINIGEGSSESELPDGLSSELRAESANRLVGRMGGQEVGAEPIPLLKKIYDKNTGEPIGDVVSFEPSSAEGKYVVVVDKNGSRIRMVLSQEQVDNQLHLNST